MIKKGTSTKPSPLQFLVLLLLSKGPKYGYELLTTLQNDLGEHWKIKSGTLYPSLRSLEKKKMVRTETLEDKEFYFITDLGTEIVENTGKRFCEEYSHNNIYFQTMLKNMPIDLQLSFIETVLECQPKSELTEIIHPLFVDSTMRDYKMRLLDQMIEQAEESLGWLKNQRKLIERN